MNNAPFVALVGPEKKPLSARLGSFVDALRRRHQLVRLLETPGLAAFGVSDAGRLVLPEHRGMIWGHVFERSSGCRITSGEASLAVGRAEDFMGRFWGGYVAVRALDGGVEVMRDPSGGTACYRSEIDGVHLFTSQPSLLFDHRLCKPDIDWAVVAQSLAFSDLRPAATALRGVSELLPGMAAQIEGGAIQVRCAWSPWRFAEKATELIERERAVGALREVMRMTLAAWGSCFERPLLEISGGLDSSIVAAGLASAGSAHCLTFGPPPGDPDERPYARAVAQHLGLALTELPPGIEGIDVSRSDARHLPRPCARSFSQALDRPIQALARELGSDAFIGGGGGDSVFCHLQSALPLIDRLENAGPGMGTMRTALDIAQQSRTHLWAVFQTAARRWGRRRNRLPSARPNRFLARDPVEALPWPAGNPWLEAPADLAPGKKRHGWAVLAIHNHLEGYGREALAPHISPLMSQPILEACLAIPTWLWVEGGNNRVIAREAFRDMLPASVIDRRTKGGFDTFAVQLIEANKPVIEAMLLDGALARERLLDAGEVERFLHGRLGDNEGVAELLSLVDVEAWVGEWERRSV